MKFGCRLARHCSFWRLGFLCNSAQGKCPGPALSRETRDAPKTSSEGYFLFTNVARMMRRKHTNKEIGKIYVG